MKISQFNQLIAEETRIFLRESNNTKVLAALDKLIQAAPGPIPELEKVVVSNLLPYIASTLPESLEEVEGDDSPPIEKAAAAAKGAAGTAGYVLSHLPMGKRLGVMIATALDATTADHVRNAVFFALGNLIAGQLGLDLPDLGDFIQEIPEELWSMLPFTDDEQEWDWGAINAMDDIALLTWAWLKVKNAVDVEEKLHEFGKFIGRSNLGKQPDRGIEEMKIKKSEIYKIIQEELEVVLTNEEVEEVFNLDLSALLDEMMNEEEMRTAKGNVTQAARKKHATVGKDKFPIFDKKSAEAAIDLRGHAPEADRAKIINKAAKFAPEAAKKAREADKKKD